MSKIDLGKPLLFRKEFLEHINEWLTDEKVERILFYPPEEEKELAELKERDRKRLMPEYFDESNY